MRYASVDINARTIYVEKEKSKKEPEKRGRYYWSTHPCHKSVYHTCKKCTEGNNIEKRYLKSGDSPPAGYRKCRKCDILENSGSCETGVPSPAR